MIPKDMRLRPQWIMWRWEQVDGRKTKVPYSPLTGKKAAVNRPREWTDYSRAYGAKWKYKMDGVGFVFTKDDDFVGIDIDHCFNDETGEIADIATELMGMCQERTYVELSPSGSGIHIIGLDARHKGEAGRRKDSVEVYHYLRYFTVTGNSLGAEVVGDISDVIEHLHQTILRKGLDIKSRNNGSNKNFEAEPLESDDGELLEKLFAKPDGEMLRELYNGGNPRSGDASRDDLYFCWRLNLANRNNFVQTDRIFRASGRMREKWDVVHFSTGETYGQRTLQKAASNCR